LVNRDWKKLTFYYFADAYINFNSLVTDLFKIYKTRIWMSAINPASFVTPTSSLNVPPPFSAIGVPIGRSSPAGRRRHQGHNPAQSSAAEYIDPSDHARSIAAGQGAGLRNAYFNPYQSLTLGNGMQQDIASLPHAMYNQLASPDPFTSYAGHQYAMLDPNAPSFSTSQRPGSRPSQAERSPGHDWTGNFRTLTLGGN
jgi:PSP1 C-terminal conserved region